MFFTSEVNKKCDINNVFLSGNGSRCGKAISGKSIQDGHGRPAVWGNYWQGPSGPEHHNLNYNLFDKKKTKKN